MSGSDVELRELADGKLRLDFPAPSVARLTIANVARRNALDHAILDAMANAVADLTVRCLLVTAEGPTFSAGYDLADLPGAGFAHRAESLVAHPFHGAIEALEGFEFPAVAALNGHAIGGGLELALSCDLRVAAESARVGMPPARLGLIYSHTGIRKFLDVVGAARTRELFLVGENITASRALEWGLVNEVVPDDRLAERGLALATQIAANAPLALSGNKRVIRELLAAEGRLDPAIEDELVRLRESCFRSEDFLEGVEAFAEKRAPQWKGR